MNKSMMHTYENNTPQAWDDIRNHEALFESFASMYLREPVSYTHLTLPTITE